MNSLERPTDPRSLRREAAGGYAVPGEDRGATPSGTAATLPPLTRDPGAARCVMCDHARRCHTDGTDGAGWCAGTTRCDCGGFQAVDVRTQGGNG